MDLVYQRMLALIEAAERVAAHLPNNEQRDQLIAEIDRGKGMLLDVLQREERARHQAEMQRIKRIVFPGSGDDQ